MPIIEEKFRLQKIMDPPKTSEGLDAHYQSRFGNEWTAVDRARIQIINRDPELSSKLARHKKVYGNCAVIQLPPRSLKLANNPSLASSLLERRSVREFEGNAIELLEVSNLIGYSFGSSTNPESRTSPSAGNRSPLELYLLVLNVKGLPPGIYHYDAANHSLELMREESNVSALAGEIGYGENIDLRGAGFVAIVTGVFHRTVAKYGRRGWRFVYIDAGHLAQNLWLVATALKISGVEMGGGYDRKIETLLDLNSGIEAPIVSFAFGK